MFKVKNRSNEIVKLSGEIGIPNDVVTIKPSSGDQWLDFGYWLEATSFMARQAMFSKGWSEATMKKYIRDYLEKAFETYTVNDYNPPYKPE